MAFSPFLTYKKNSFEQSAPGVSCIRQNLSTVNQLSMKYQNSLNQWKSGLYHEGQSFILLINFNANNFWHFNIYEQDKFHAQLS